jgi:hypothetical protein
LKKFRLNAMNSGNRVGWLKADRAADGGSSGLQFGTIRSVEGADQAANEQIPAVDQHEEHDLER